MNLNKEKESFDTTSPGYSLELPTYSFHLLSGTDSEENYQLSLEYSDDIPPSDIEISTYINKYITGYALSRWLEALLLAWGVPSKITTKEGNDWANDEKLISARGGICPIYFVEDTNTFLELGREHKDKDILIVYMGGVMIQNEYLQHLTIFLDTILADKSKFFSKNAIKSGISIGNVLDLGYRGFVLTPKGSNGVIVSGSKAPGTISHKIMGKIDESLKNLAQRTQKTKNKVGKIIKK